MAHTLESCRASAAKYQSKQAWRSAEYGAMQAAVRNGWFAECTNHMLPAKRGTKPGTTHLTTAEWVAKAQAQHGDQYDYSAAVFKGATEKLTIICPEHGSFEQVAWTHINGTGCPKCGKLKAKASLSFSREAFVAAAREIHGDAYDYAKVIYDNNQIDVEIVCPEHGSFWQRPGNHINKGYGCPRCKLGGRVSLGEQEVFEFVRAICPDARQSERKVLGGKMEIDIFVPSLNLGIEFNGLVYHSTRFGKDVRYHQQKTELAAGLGVRLVHIWEDEWREKRSVVEGYLRRLLGVPARKIGARSCEIVPTTGADQRAFLEANHLQGFRSGKGFAMLHAGEVVAVALVSKNWHGEMELTRWCVKQGIDVVGGFSRIMCRFDVGPIISFCDVAKHAGMGYLAAGWELVGRSPVMTYYTDGKVRRGRYGFQKKLLCRNPAVTGNTETEMAASIGFHEIGGCEQLKFCYTP